MASTMADAGSGPTLTRPAQHPERISSSRARSSAKRHPPRVQGALPPGRRREVPEPRAPPIKRQPFSPGSRIPAQHVSSPSHKKKNCSVAAPAPPRRHHVWHLSRAWLLRLVSGKEGSHPRLLQKASTRPFIALNFLQCTTQHPRV